MSDNQYPGDAEPGSSSGRLAETKLENCGGEGGIRTPGTVARTSHFECDAFDHSATSPRGIEPAGSMVDRAISWGVGAFKAAVRLDRARPRFRLRRPDGPSLTPMRQAGLLRPHQAGAY